ncbi:HesB/YadR/YfhF family protein [Gottfriedia acidiceleris]|uniref:HesB/YadR/YfhF family protein n=1 Tax=Gottfriedia acidiceleris TaxID=371036 RepID=A0ABY4JKI1_9BACI|nr:HesB/YadR/YfhF family protein [Gottfriedia acidiceleris]UPM53679.1 HesB/YadR/YfhF family protein [Gottfriedia acidiceleris]
MKITISEDALKWFQDEMNVKGGDTIRFFARYGGNSTIHKGYSLGVTKEQPVDIGESITIDNVVYFINETDLWYFKDYNLSVIVNENNELHFDYEPK